MSTARFLPPPPTGSAHQHDEHSHSHSHDHDHDHEHHGADPHGHTHELMEHPGKFSERDLPDHSGRNWKERAFTIGIGGPVGSGKTALTLALCRYFRDTHNIGVVTNDIFTKEDQEFLIKNEALSEPGRIKAIETGTHLFSCGADAVSVVLPESEDADLGTAVIREDISANMGALEELQAEYGCELLFVESGGDNLAANYSRELADYIIYVIDVSGGDKIPRKGGPGISQSDLLIVNKIDLAPYVGASLEVMRRDADRMRDGGPTLFTSVKLGQGVEGVAELIVGAWTGATGGKAGLAKA
ncbi:hypothetical protein RQP46_007335 [Phenoliferia psychrophenolica]